MNRIRTTFERLAETGRKGLVGYLTAGDPDRDRSLADIRTALEAGLDILELGVPFSDPTADGPTIQAASHRALGAGMTVGGVLDLAAEVRRGTQAPIVLFGYANPFFRYGYSALCARAAQAGVDALLVVDLPREEATDLVGLLDAHGLCLVPLVAPTTPMDRARRIVSDAKGFIYYIMVTGVTGARAELATDLGRHMQELRACTDLPIAAGFGVSTGEQARRVAADADAVVVGSALVKAARSGRLGDVVRELRAGLDGGA
jgi:tryptophan synthase alpha chain